MLTPAAEGLSSEPLPKKDDTTASPEEMPSTEGLARLLSACDSGAPDAGLTSGRGATPDPVREAAADGGLVAAKAGERSGQDQLPAASFVEMPEAEEDAAMRRADEGGAADAISPTLPFDVVLGQETAGKPDAPEKDADVSPTLPFDVLLPDKQAHAGESSGGLSPTLPFDVLLGTDPQVPAETSATEVPPEAARAPAALERPSLAPEPSQDAPSSEDEDGEELTAAQRREREWRRHQRQRLRQEEKQKHSKVRQKGVSTMKASAKGLEEEEADDLFLSKKQQKPRGLKRSILLLGPAGAGG